MCKCGADAVGVTSVRPVAKASVKQPYPYPYPYPCPYPYP